MEAGSDQMPEDEITNRELSYVVEDLERLQECEDLSESAFRRDWKNVLIVERLLERIFNRLIDIAYHVTAKERGRSQSITTRRCGGRRSLGKSGRVEEPPLSRI